MDGCLADTDSITYGVNYRSPLNDLAHFHVANSQLPQDIMHILFEGVVPYELGLLLKEFICRQHYFSEELLNERIDCFNYTSDEKRDKPTKINIAASLRQSGKSISNSLYNHIEHIITLSCSNVDFGNTSSPPDW